MILLTGFTGMLGGEIARQLDKRKLDWTYLPQGQDAANPLNFERLRGLEDVEYIINCAAWTDTSVKDDASEESNECWHSNVRVAETLSWICKEYNIKLIHVSTNYVMDPVNHYAITKQYAESAIAGGCKNYTMFPSHDHLQ